ncbi:MAG: GTP-binding protein [Acidimicrobiales bacterium]|jgi:bifunctional enzyme CysN/CysC|nr:GTP-binding protein [Acidimicrobiales bacterium]HJM29330.1 GTP-binding protein [Acidimicrobiales bacterium]HJM98483.1 GTP-binding protein [Acidimicrobiales bacterium]
MELLRFATAGSVDDGKSTLIGRLLFDSKSVFEDQIEAVERTSEQMGADYTNLALLTDGLRAEREQGITIDVAYRYFATPKRKFIVADTPGHTQYTRNMVTGASTADLALILVDVRKGITEQTKRHAFISTLLGIPHLVLCINKMDLVGYEKEAFDSIRSEFADFAAKLQIHDLVVIPISALHGDNVVDRSLNMQWYGGASLLHHLEEVHIGSDRNLIDPRFPIQYVLRPQRDDYHDYRGYAGTVASGSFRIGDEVLILPSGFSSTIVEINGPQGPLQEAYPPLSVAMRFSEEYDISRGDMICRSGNQPKVAQGVDAMICWFTPDSFLESKRKLVIKHSTNSTRCLVEELIYRLDINTLHREELVDRLTMNEIGRVKLRTMKPLMFDAYKENRSTGAFILIDENTHDTVGAGMILGSTD